MNSIITVMKYVRGSSRVPTILARKVAHVERDSEEYATVYFEPEENGDQHYMTIDQRFIDAIKSL